MFSHEKIYAQRMTDFFGSLFTILVLYFLWALAGEPNILAWLGI